MKDSRINRRQFIVVGSAAVAGLTVSPVLGNAAAATPQLFVGFAPRIGRGRAVGGRPRAAVFAAEGIGQTEPSFIRTGARFSIRELRRRSGSPLSLRFDVLHPVDGEQRKVPFHAWAYEGSDHRSSSPIAFNVPIDPVLPLDAVVSIRSGVHDITRTVSFTVTPAEGAIALNTGRYIFAIAERAPDWGSLRIDGDVLTMGIDSRPAPFDYLILTVTSPVP